MAQDTNPTPSAVVKQIGGTHYKDNEGICPHCGGGIQHWDLYAGVPYLEAYAAKELIRWREKGGIEDLDKTISIIQKIIAIERLKESKKPTLIPRCQAISELGEQCTLEEGHKGERHEGKAPSWTDPKPPLFVVESADRPS
jgi:hypothetical protein